LQSVETAVELRERELLAWRLLARGLGTMGLIALVLVVTGLYGVMAFSVARRTREIGVRMALGADRTGVLRMVVGESLGLVRLGLAIGGGLALGVAMLLRSLLFGVSPLDPVTYGALAALLVAVGILAALVPARRAATVEPVRALAE
ncbi:MAG: FtsX-like permease family protein, partial [Gemmatimonadota bacterium]